MDPTLLATLSACAVVLAAGALVVSVRARGRVRTELEAVRVELAALQARVDRLSPRTGAQGPVRDEDEFVITTLATAAPAPGPVAPDADEDRRLSGADFVSVAVGESLVRVLSLAHGVRRALSAENRNRMAFEVRREVKRSRRQRRRDVRDAQRDMRTRRQAGADDAGRQDAA